MHPLVFLFTRQIINGVKRALTNARRLISLVVFLGYYIYIFMLRTTGPRRMPGLQGREVFSMPPLWIISGGIFAVYLVLSVFMALGLTARQSSFRTADADVLFPTPVEPRTVLAFRLGRDYFFTLIFPIFIAIFTWRPVSDQFKGIIKGLPETGPFAFKALVIAYFAQALFWVAFGNAITLYITRTDDSRDRAKKILSIAGWAYFLIPASYVVYTVMARGDWETVARSTFLRVIFLPAALSTEVVMGPLSGNLTGSVLALGGIVVLAIGCLMAAMNQAGYFYDHAAVMSVKSQSRAAQRAGDTTLVFAQQAREGKIKVKKRWYSELKIQGPSAIIWREMVLQARTTGKLFYIFGPLVLGPLAGILISRSMPAGAMAGFFVFFEAFAVFMLTALTCQSGFLETLRRGDFQKPLPFGPSIVAGFEILAKALYPVVTVVVFTLATIVIAPDLWPTELAAMLFMPTFALLLTSVYFTNTMLFPDFEDPSQKGFRGLMVLLMLAICGVPGFGAAVFLYLELHQVSFGPFVAALIGGSINLVVAGLLAFFGGSLYGTFNPSE